MEKGDNRYSSANIFIISSLSLQSEVLLYVINKEIGANCKIFDRDLNDFSENAVYDNFSEDNKPLLLIDSESQSFEEILKSVSINRNLANSLIAIFNLKVNTMVEKKALSRKIKGFFYKDDQFEIFLKGIRAMLDGEIWIPRKVLLQYVFDSLEEKQSIIEEKTALTPREIEILSLISMGTTNDEIADQMCISTNTVKTHLYNIFKKINVPNRLQAALWAAQNL